MEIINNDIISMKRGVSRLQIFCNDNCYLSSMAVSISKILAESILNIRENMRSIHLEECFLKSIEDLPDDVYIKDIDVLFNPDYKIDVLKLLISAYQKKHFKVIWPGTYVDGKLMYGEEGFIDYKTFEVCSYDIMCVIGGKKK